MFSLKYIFLITALVALISAQQLDDSMEDMDSTDDIDEDEDMDLEAVEDLPSTQTTDSEVFTTEESYKSIEEQTEPTEEPSEPFESTQNMERVMGETTEPTKESMESIEDKTETIIIFEEMEGMVQPKDDNSNESSIAQTSTDSNDTISSEFNGFDVNRSESLFSCFGRPFGQYADVKKECHIFHMCYPYFNSTTDELLYQRITFLCDNDSVFDQKRFICVDNSTVDHKCSDSEDLYLQTNQEYLIRVFTQTVSPIDEVRGQTSVRPSNRNWFNWLYGH